MKSHQDDRTLKQYQNFNYHQFEPETNNSHLDWKQNLLDVRPAKNPDLGYNPTCFRPDSIMSYYCEKDYAPFNRTDYEDLEVPADFSPPLIVGMARCGTSFIASTLFHHQKLYPINEFRTPLTDIVPTMDIYTTHATKESAIPDLDDLTEEQILNIRQLCYKTQLLIEEKLGRHGRVLVKEPDLSLFRVVIDGSFGNSKVFEVSRPAKTAVRSMYKYRLGWDREKNGFIGYDNKGHHYLLKYLEKHPEVTDKLGITEKLHEIGDDEYEQFYLWYAGCGQLMIDWAEKHGKDRYLKMSYDDFVQKPRQAFTKLVQFFGLEADEKFLQKVEELSSASGAGNQAERESFIFSQDVLQRVYESNLTRV